MDQPLVLETKTWRLDMTDKDKMIKNLIEELEYWLYVNPDKEE